MYLDALRAVAPYLLLRRASRNVYGLSIDMIYWQIFGSFWTVMYYICAAVPKSQRQYTNRLQTVALDTTSMVFHAHQVIIWAVIAIHAWVKRYTISREVQGISLITMVFSGLLGAMTLAVFLALNYRYNPEHEWGYATVMWIDFVNCMWAMGQFGEIFSLVPQIAVNWKLMTSGTSIRFNCVLLISCIATGITLIPAATVATTVPLLVIAFQTVLPATLIAQHRIYIMKRSKNIL